MSKKTLQMMGGYVHHHPLHNKRDDVSYALRNQHVGSVRCYVQQEVNADEVALFAYCMAIVCVLVVHGDELDVLGVAPEVGVL